MSILHEAGAHRKQLPALTGLRGVGAAWVVLFHLTPISSTSIFSTGYLGVDLFFILSGFVLCHAHPENVLTWHRYGQFLKLRLARIYPLHVVVLTAYAAVALSLPGFMDAYPMATQRFSADAFAASLLLIQNWGCWLPLCWNAPAWSLSAEWAAYLAFPLFQLGSQRWRSAMVPTVLAVLGWAIMALLFRSVGVTLFQPGTPGMARMIVGFGVGCLLHRAWRNGLAIGENVGMATAVVLLSVALRTNDWMPFVIPAFAIIVLLGAQQRGPVAWIMATPPLLWLGKISYSVYLTHYIILQIANWSARRWDMALPREPFYSGIQLAVILAAATLTYNWVEEPARRWARQLRQHTATAPAIA